MKNNTQVAAPTTFGQNCNLQILIQWNRIAKFHSGLNEKLYKQIFANRIRPKYLKNSQMVLSMLCNDEKKLSELFWYKCVQKSYCLIPFFWSKEPPGI